MRSRIEVAAQPTGEEDEEVLDATSLYLKEIGQIKVIEETKEQHRLARQIFLGQLALRALEAVRGSKLLTSPQTECIRELLVDKTAKLLLDNYPTPLKKPETQAKELSSFLSVADRYIRWVDRKPNIDEQIEFASQGLKSFNEMVRGNLRLVVSIADRQNALNISLLDKVSYGNEALMKAVAKFDFRRGNRFSTFAERNIEWAIRRGIDSSDNIIRIPTNPQRDYWKTRRQGEQHAAGSGDNTPALLEMKRIYALKTPMYFSEPLSTDEDSQEFGNSLPSEEPDPLETVLARVNAPDQVRRLLQCLTPRELKMVRQRFGLDGDGGLTLEEIGNKEGGLTRERIRWIIDKILKKMRDAAKKGLPGVDKPDNHQPPKFTLTPCQVQVLQYAVDGLSNQEIAVKLENSANTIRNHMVAIYQIAAGFGNFPKPTFEQVVELATQKGFIKIPEGQEIISRAGQKKRHTPTRTAGVYA